MEHHELLIIGGGQAGISLAARLLRDGAQDVAVLESEPVHRYRPLLNYVGAGQIQGNGIDLEDFVRDSGAKVVIYSWNLKPEMIEQAMAGGARGYLSEVLTGAEIVAALERVM